MTDIISLLLYFAVYDLDNAFKFQALQTERGEIPCNIL